MLHNAVKACYTHHLTAEAWPAAMPAALGGVMAISKKEVAQQGSVQEYLEGGGDEEAGCEPFCDSMTHLICAHHRRCGSS